MESIRRRRSLWLPRADLTQNEVRIADQLGSVKDGQSSTGGGGFGEGEAEAEISGQGSNSAVEFPP